MKAKEKSDKSKKSDKQSDKNLFNAKMNLIKVLTREKK